ncbi:jg23022 [Pararge aegeria aegeria]|uniref:Jg23022 protein n=2 Tax=Pararge aegeria TaxID=116150 RepID=A0A8S4SQJ8_9NEOP|nr:jg23022 [Pararge aegeria aegeria]
MALPSGFEGPKEYFEKFFNFIQKYEYLFNFPNTDLLVNEVLDKIEMNLQELDIFQEVFDIRKLNCEYLTDFFEDLDKFDVKYEDFKDNDNLEFLIEVPLSVKKKHEIAYLANEIENVCGNIQCDTIVDFGSGLGYLDEQIFKTTNFNVLGLECNETNYVGAKKRQRKYYIDSMQRVKYIKHTIKPESTNIQEFLNDKFPNCKGFCIAGLHACADLTVDAIDMFLKMEHARALIIMPCCYHRIMEGNGGFKNFPLSRTLNEAYEEYSGFKYLTVPFLRLATQPPHMETEKIEDYVFNLLSRAVLQVYANEHNCKLKRNKRKAVRLKTLDNNFEAYAADAVNGFKLFLNKSGQESQVVSNNFERNIIIEDLISIWRQIPQLTFKKSAVFVLLQNSMQPAFENFVLYDRLVYLQEKGIEKCMFKKIVNEKISPRCLALIAQK